MSPSNKPSLDRRVGLGFDIHRLEAEDGAELSLAGAQLPVGLRRSPTPMVMSSCMP